MELKRAIQIIRRMRHDFGNHLQVISGFLELGRYQDLREYLDYLVELLAAERIVFESPDEKTILFLYEQLLLARDLGIILRYKEIKLKSVDAVKLLQDNGEPHKTLASQASRLRTLKADEPTVTLSLHETAEGIDLVFGCEEYFADNLVISLKE
ncbi:MAG: Spo0B domain-containing protein [Syntrophomonadaceae bacterium]